MIFSILVQRSVPVARPDRLARHAEGDVRVAQLSSVGVPHRQRHHRNGPLGTSLALGMFSHFQLGA